MFCFCPCGNPRPLNSCCQASTDRSGHSGDLIIHSCPKALLESTLKLPLINNWTTLNINKYEHSVVAKLRSGTLPLYIEKGRYVVKNLESRTCPICKTKEVEDERHFAINCNGYAAKGTYFSPICVAMCLIFL